MKNTKIFLATLLTTLFLCTIIITNVSVLSLTSEEPAYRLLNDVSDDDFTRMPTVFK